MILRHLPNAISLFRIALIGPLLLALWNDRFDLAFLMFGVAGFSDGLDGFLARRFGWQSRLGGVLDPVADKLLMLGVFAVLALKMLIPPWFAVLVIGRDLIIVGGALLYRVLVGPFEGHASVVSKVNTALLLLFVISLLAAAAFGWPPRSVLTALGGAVIVSAVVSGLDYVRTGIVLAAQHKPEDKT